jgi:hypothetical protein
MFMKSVRPGCISEGHKGLDRLNLPFLHAIIIFHRRIFRYDRLCGLVVRVLGYKSGGPGSIPGTTRKNKSSGAGTGSTQPREYK